VDKLEQLPDKSAFVFRYDAQAAVVAEDNQPLLRSEIGRIVVRAFLNRIRASDGAFTAENFKAIINEVKNETGAKGKELFHPIRIIITGSHSGPDFDRVIPLIESGSKLPLPQHVMSVSERSQAFEAAFRADALAAS
jgi:glutamyl-tRNA synthetase/nondiscriminating glutamyl-tRNA synthetase